MDKLRSELKSPSLLVITHGGCPDGLGGAWAFWREFKDNSSFEICYAKHGSNPPNCEDKLVYVVDFSYDVNTMLAMAKSARRFVLLDHHESTTEAAKALTEAKLDNVSVVLDMDRSGAQIAWDHLYPCQARPWFIDDIADRGLWNWKIEGSHAVTTALFHKGYYKTMEAFDQIRYNPREHYVNIGNPIIEVDQRNVESLARHATKCLLSNPQPKDDDVKPRVYNVMLAEVPYMYRSDVGNQLLKDNADCQIAVLFSYDITEDQWWLSARSRPGEVNLAKELKPIFGNGGGHPSAAGAFIFGKTGQNLRTYFTPFPKEEKKDSSSPVVAKVDADEKKDEPVNDKPNDEDDEEPADDDKPNEDDEEEDDKPNEDDEEEEDDKPNNDDDDDDDEEEEDDKPTDDDDKPTDDDDKPTDDDDKPNEDDKPADDENKPNDDEDDKPADDENKPNDDEDDKPADDDEEEEPADDEEEKDEPVTLKAPADDNNAKESKPADEDLVEDDSDEYEEVEVTDDDDDDDAEEEPNPEPDDKTKSSDEDKDEPEPVGDDEEDVVEESDHGSDVTDSDEDEKSPVLDNPRISNLKPGSGSNVAKSPKKKRRVVKKKKSVVAKAIRRSSKKK